MMECLVNNKLERMQEEVAVANLKLDIPRFEWKDWGKL
jgi:hypothetical protein